MRESKVVEEKRGMKGGLNGVNPFFGLPGFQERMEE